MVRGLLRAVASLAVEHRLKGAQAPAAAAHGLRSSDSVFAAQLLSCPRACGIFPDQGLNPRPLHWQVDS